MELYRYRLQGRSLTVPSRVIHLTVTAANADDARRIARIRCSDFGTTLPRTGVRRVGRVILDDERIDRGKAQLAAGERVEFEPEQADGMTQAKAREFVTWRGCEVEVVG